MGYALFNKKCRVFDNPLKAITNWIPNVIPPNHDPLKKSSTPASVTFQEAT